MRIALVSSHPFYYPGGVQEQVKGLYQFLKSKDYNVKVLAPRHDKNENYGKDFLLFGKDMPFTYMASTANISFCFNLSKLKKTLEKENFDIIHLHNLGLFMPIQVLNFSKAKNILTLHTLPEGNFFDKFIADTVKTWAQANLSNAFASIIGTSKPVIRNVNGIYHGPRYVIPNGIDLKRFNSHVKKIEEFLDGKINILFVGRFDEKKGLRYLLNAFEILKKKQKNIRLIIVGTGPEEKKYKDLVKQKKLKDVVFTGYVDTKELPRYYATCDIFCSPSVFGEGFGIVLIEAMASGKPIVAFANTGYKSVITEKFAKRFLVKPKDVKELAKTLETLIENKKLREKLGKWGLKEVKRYSWEKVGKQILEVYKKVL